MALKLNVTHGVNIIDYSITQWLSTSKLQLVEKSKHRWNNTRLLLCFACFCLACIALVCFALQLLSGSKGEKARVGPLQVFRPRLLSQSPFTAATAQWLNHHKSGSNIRTSNLHTYARLLLHNYSCLLLPAYFFTLTFFTCHS